MESAFLKIIEQNQNIIHKVSRIYRDSREDQEDLFQEIVFQLWKAFPNYREEAKISTWMYRIALNTAIVTYRKKKVTINYSEAIPENIHPTTANELSENEERMYNALRKLSEAERALMSLFLEDYSYREIGEITGISENYVAVKINRIKNKLKQLLN
ncbi:RNA polymerase sigma factor [Chondrinema litorale]|uniref:RNA polymerase sigma factor n=1 Tax=Chondrinema litorale TaxID=2994555 RepID=UPI002543DD3E|nr:sigma-70 family RNA polymerase sigma factor [Chondrinema litorale]UZR97965.1 sigma-70 family RNA polymerase sigma factor [Chondrinema litorale]